MRKITVNFNNSDCGGKLDVNMKAPPTAQEPMKNVYCDPGNAPEEEYRVEVIHPQNQELSGCQDPKHFKVAVSVGGSVQEFTGSISNKKIKFLHEFVFDSSKDAW